MTIPRATLFTLALLALVVGCGRGGGENPSHPLGQTLLDQVPEGFEPVDGASGPMELDDAITAVGYVSPTRVRSQLTRTGFQDGYSRVWRDEDGKFITSIVFDFINERRADELVTWAEGKLEELRGASPFSVPEVPESVGYTLNAKAPGSSEALFCQVVWFAVETRTYEVRECSPRPSSPLVVQELAERQHAEAS